MQRLSLLLLCLALLGLEDAIASPTAFPPTGPGGWDGWGDWNHRQCISDAQAADFVDKIHSLYHCMDGVLAEQTLTEDFMSFSYTWLRGGHENPITEGNNILASSRSEFITQGYATNPFTCDAPPVKTYKIWNGCDIVGFWWAANASSGMKEPAEYYLVGIDIIEIDVGEMKVRAEYSEFSGLP